MRNTTRPIHIAAADHELAEGLDHVPGGLGALVAAVEQDAPGGGDVQAQAEQSNEPDRREKENGIAQMTAKIFNSYKTKNSGLSVNGALACPCSKEMWAA